MVSDGAALPLSCAAVESVRLRIDSAVRSFFMVPCSCGRYSDGRGKPTLLSVETRLAASCRENGNGGQTCVLGLNHREEEEGGVTSEHVTAELRSAWTGVDARPSTNKITGRARERPHPHTFK